jgi:hypothetical protein
MKLFDLLKLEAETPPANECKIHLAVWNGNEHPLDEFLAGRFIEWQRWQNNRNFERPYIISLIKMDGASRWLFAGVHATNGCTYHSAKRVFRYDTNELQSLAGLTGRLIIEFTRSGRQSYLKAENWAGRLLVKELMARPLEIEAFSGFSQVLLLKSKLDIIVKQEIESWKAALSSVAGIYLITDTMTGRHYVGSAYGVGGIWARWKVYSETGHGQNKNLKELLCEKGATHSSNFQFCILETADTNASEEEVLARETHWKDALCSRESHGGLNAN